MKEKITAKPVTGTRKRFRFADLWQKKQMRSIVIAAGIVLLCGLVYLVLSLTVLKPAATQESVDNGLYVIEKMKVEQIRTVRVKHQEGGFCYYLAEDGEYYFEGAESLLYDSTADYLSGQQAPDQMVDPTGFFSMTDSLMLLLSQLYAEQELMQFNEDLSVYGLDGAGKASVELTFVDAGGTERCETIIFGNKLVGTKAYYLRLANRNAVYVISDIYVTRCIFADLEDYLLPQVALSIPSSEIMNVESISLRKHGEEFISMRILNEEEKKVNDELFTHVLTYPNVYYPSSEKMQVILEKFVNFSGNSVVDYNLSERMKGDSLNDDVIETLKLYSLLDADSKWVCELSVSYGDYDSLIYFSEKLEVLSETEDEASRYIYYAYSPDFDVVVEFNAEDLVFLEWDLLSYLDNHIFSVNIDNVYMLELMYQDTHAKFTLEDKAEKLKITSSNGVPVVTDNFRQLYKAILFITMDGYAERPEGASSILKIKIILRTGEIMEFDFFGMTARRAYYTLNGAGEFYINRDYVKQIITACNNLLAGESVTVEQKK